ncbi:MAG: hypothetical protein KGZ25_10515, partial [Planctomycetes bacterium]|nr:hypothetical protein [Planctomycetota bacterium]
LDPDVEIAICAHTHRPSIDSTGPLMINPGEVGAWLTGRSTGVLLDLDECSAEILEFGRQEVPQL